MAAPPRPELAPASGRHLVARRRARWLDWLPMAVALPLYAAGIGWGIGDGPLWSWDELTPAAVLAPPYRDGVSWPAKYPLLHRDLLAPLYRAVGWCGERLGASGAGALARPQLLAGRWLSVALALVTLWLVQRSAGRLAGRSAALAASGLWLAVLPQVYYAKTTNLDAPSLFWVALALHGFVRLAARPTLGATLGFALPAACAALTKDQTLGLFALPGLWVAGLVYQEHSRALRDRSRPAWLAPVATLEDRRLWVPLAAGLLGAAASYRLLSGGGWLAAHLAVLGYHPDRFAFVATGLGGQLDLARLAGKHLVFCFGTAVSIAVGLGLAALAPAALQRRPPRARRTLPLLLFPLSYYLISIAPLRFHYDRFLLPVCLVLSVVAGVGLATSLGRLRGQRALLWAGWSLFGAAVAFSLWRGIAVDSDMVGDRRREVERATRGSSRAVAFVREVRTIHGFELKPVRRGDRVAPADLASFEYVAVPAADLGEFALAALARRLAAGECGFEAVPVERRSLARRVIDYRGVLSNLTEIDPPIRLFRRTGPGADCPTEEPAELSSAPLAGPVGRGAARVGARPGWSASAPPAARSRPLPPPARSRPQLERAAPRRAASGRPRRPARSPTSSARRSRTAAAAATGAGRAASPPTS